VGVAKKVGHQKESHDAERKHYVEQYARHQEIQTRVEGEKDKEQHEQDAASLFMNCYFHSL
jgi:hypothetical protein